MARRRRTNVYRKKGRIYRRKRKKVTATNNMGPLAVKLPSKFIYEDSFILNPGLSGVPSEHIFCANGLYDPNITGTGHQPRGFDQLMTLYDHYVVIGAKITLWVSSEDLVYANMIALWLDDDNAALGSVTDIMEKRYVKLKNTGVETSGTSNTVMSLKCNPNKFLGRSSPLSDPELKGSVAGNPTERAFFKIGCFPMRSGTDSSAVACRVRIEYSAILIEPKQPTAS